MHGDDGQIAARADRDIAAAGQLARRAYGILRALGDHDRVLDIGDVSGVVSFPDEVGPRYQFTISLLMNGEIV